MSSFSSGEPPLNKEIVCCVSVGDGSVFFVVGQRVDIRDERSFVYYSPEHGEEFELNNVVDWHHLP